MMYHPSTRLLAVLELLQSHDRLSGADMARRLEVDRRTVRRYVAMLQDLGIPVEGIRGTHGGYRLRPGFKLPPMMFTDDEAATIAVGLFGAKSLGLAPDPAIVEGALAKFERVLPATVREHVQMLRDAVTLDMGSFDPAASGVLLQVSESAATGRSLEIRYRAQSGDETVRVIDPYGVALRLGAWYVVGYCHLRRDLRTFRLDRIRELAWTDETFTRPAGFDSLAYVNQCMATLPGRWKIDVLLELSLAEAERRIPQWFAVLEPDGSSTRLRAQYDDLALVARYLVQFGCRFTVREPDELRDMLHKRAHELAAMTEPTCYASTVTDVKHA
jgi:predicted DNA-binding transcriptional regulator YafY